MIYLSLLSLLILVSQCESGAMIDTLGDSSFTASSSICVTYPTRTANCPEAARMSLDGWVGPSPPQVGDYLQVDLGASYTIGAIGTKGRDLDNADQWTTSYKLLYSSDDITYTYYNNSRIFDGNTDKNTEVIHELYPLITARYLRWEVVSFTGFPAMRVEAYGVILEYVSVDSISVSSNNCPIESLHIGNQLHEFI